MQDLLHTRQISLKGLVQGVGFRPFVYRLAHKYDLKGWVNNTNEGVVIQVEGNEMQIDSFLEELVRNPPKASAIYSVHQNDCSPDYFTDFSILKSRTTSDRITQVSPDIAVCDDCIRDMKTQAHRLAYPFINCTHCGPRFTIIRKLPYDRQTTTMEPFAMCDVCRSEYEAVHDRRFHAQPVACTFCGPEYTLIHGKERVTGIYQILETCAEITANGGIIAIKGLGGFYLMCNAADEFAVGKLRNAKHRDGKPFAVMVRDLETAVYYAAVTPREEELLVSWRRPIVLLKQRRALAKEINPGCSTLGLMLPYMPFHHLMFEKLALNAVVMTSGNRSDEPIVIDNRQAQETFRDMADAILTYNREISNRVDDSVVFVVHEKQRIVRRSRGYVPEPIRLSYPVEGILATGAELSHCFAIGKGKDALLSQHIGDLKDPETHAFFQETVSRLCDLFQVHPVCVACDMHPDYLSTGFANSLSLPVINVQHHHAHIAACMAEYQLNEPVIGICWDGSGLGSDGHIWGGEFLYADLSSFKRFTHFDYIPLPGGDKAARETWRTGVACLYQILGRDFLKRDLPFVLKVREKPELDLILHAIDRKLNTPLSSSAGRLFDAVAAITDISHFNSFHAEAPMKLEAIVDDRVEKTYPFTIGNTVSFAAMFREIVSDIQNRVPVPVISAKFHNSLVSVIFTVANNMKEQCNTGKVILSGGVFQNRYLLEKTEERLKNSFDVYSPEQVPCNDAGIALGQMAVAAQQLNRKNSS